MGRSCCRQAPHPRIPEATAGLARLLPVRCPRSLAPYPWLRGLTRGVSGSQTPQAGGLFIAEALICVCFFSPSPPLGVQESSSLGAGSLRGAPAGREGQLNPEKKELTPARLPQPAGLGTIHQEINKKRFVSICPQNTRISSLLASLACPQGPSEPQGAGQEGGSWDGQPSLGPRHPITVRPCSRQGCPGTLGG